MRIMSAFLTRVAIGALSMLACAVAASAVPLCPAGPNFTNIPCVPLAYHGGPYLESFTIYPLYLGNWSQPDIDIQQTFLTNLTAYISGVDAPAGQQPVTRQYGVNSATLAAPVMANPTLDPTKYVSSCISKSLGTYSDPPPLPAVPGTLYFCDVPQIIAHYQALKTLPAYGPQTLIMVFPATGLSLDPTCNCLGYHSSPSVSSFFGIIAPGPYSPGNPYPHANSRYQVVTSHEVFEASTDPADDKFSGWDEAADQCDTSVTVNWPGSITFQIAKIIDNSSGGGCTATGYTPLDEIQDYGVPYATYIAEYNTLWKTGWRLYILQSYVLDGQVLYNAVWRPSGGVPEYQQYGVSFAQYIAEYNTLFPEGWRIYILQSYVLPDGAVAYNAVYRQGNAAETQAYGVTYSQYRAEYNTLYPAPKYWRLYILQSYVTAGGEVLYNAVWRQPDHNVAVCACDDEVQLYGYDETDLRTKYDTMWTNGFRLYELDPYVLANGNVAYNAVFHTSTHGEIQIYQADYTDYRAEYDSLWGQGWRLYSLNTTVLPGGDVRYDAVWRQGTYDRPL
jgi:Bacterial tandem repeat domain 1